jgi:hypothetical protein
MSPVAIERGKYMDTENKTVEKPKAHVIETSCKDCVFADYASSMEPNGRWPHSCMLGKLERFEEIGAKVELITEGSDSYYKIKDRICMFCRDKNSDWGKEVPEGERVATVLEEVKPKFTAVMIFNEGDHLSSLEGVLDRLYNQTIKPYQLLVVNNQSFIPAHDITKLFQEKYADLFNQAPSVQTIFTRNEDGTPYHNDELMDLYGIFPLNCLHILPHNLIENLSNFLNDRLDRFVACSNSFIEVYQTYIAKAYRGNMPFTIKLTDDEENPPSFLLLKDKINYVAEKTGKQYMVKSLQEIMWPSPI